MAKKRHNPEKRAWRGRSYKKGGENIAKLRRKAYMDREGFLTEDPGDCKKEIRRAENWIREILDRGATIPEAMWEIKGIFDVAFENVRFSRVWKKK